MTVDEEKQLIEKMIKECDDGMVRAYCYDTEKKLGVYVRTGVHRSNSDKGLHVQVVLGSTDPSTWTSGSADTGFTVHIQYGSGSPPYIANRYNRQPHLRRRGTDVVGNPKGKNVGVKPSSVPMKKVFQNG
jgi:hypothetical protein